VRTRKHKQVLLSAAIESSKMEQIKPTIIEQEPILSSPTAGFSRAKSGLAIILLTFAFVASIGLVYISVDAMLTGSTVGLIVISDPTLTYRIGMVLAALSGFTIAAVAAINIAR
jgi:hypothetical protein